MQMLVDRGDGGLCEPRDSPSSVFTLWAVLHFLLQIGKQTLSMSRTMPAYGFGSSDRDKESTRFVTSQHAKVLQGSFSPNNYDRQQPNNITSFGKQSLSVRQNLPAYGFGSQPRLVFKTSQTPVGGEKNTPGLNHEPLRLFS